MIQEPERALRIPYECSVTGKKLRLHFVNKEIVMKKLNMLAIALLSATVATAALAKGPGGGMGAGQGRMGGQASAGTQQQGQGGGAGQGTQTRTQTRDPASNPTGQPIQSRDRLHTPGTGTTLPSISN